MRYLYGDTTPFPLNSHFLKTALAATETAAALLKLEEEQSHPNGNEATVGRIRYDAEIDVVANLLHETLRAVQPQGAAGAELVEKLASSIEEQTRAARLRAQAIGDGGAVDSSHKQKAARMHTLLERFFQQQELPKTRWGMRWHADGSTVKLAHLYAYAPLGLTATLQMDLPAQHLFQVPFRLGRIERTLFVPIMARGWFGRPALRQVPLHRYYVTQMVCIPTHEVLVLSEQIGQRGRGIKITMRAHDDHVVRLVHLDEQDNEVGEVVLLTDAQSMLLKRAWGKLKAELKRMRRRRGALVTALLDGRDVFDAPSTAPLASGFIQSVAPIIRVLSRRSSTWGELQLICQHNNGRREPLILSYETLTKKYADLSPRSQAMFDAYGLERTRPMMRTPKIVDPEPPTRPRLPLQTTIVIPPGLPKPPRPPKRRKHRPAPPRRPSLHSRVMVGTMPTA